MNEPLDPLRLCDDDAPRRAYPAGSPGWNGIDSVETDPNDRTILYAYLIRPLSKQFHATFHDKPPRTSVTVEGGERVRGLRVQSVSVRRAPEHSSQDDALVVIVDREGDFSTYTMKLHPPTFPQEAHAGHHHGAQYPDRFDPYYARADFSFKTDCPNQLDCAAASACQAEPPPEPVISYLGRDYAGLRQTAFDRLAQIIPDWTERHVPDLGVALVELFAYVGDNLSYFQDAVATEAYLGTARLRTSVRRHVRLIDYAMHEGCNARAWVVVSVAAAGGAQPQGQKPPDASKPDPGVVLPPDLLFLAGADAVPGSDPVTGDQMSKLPPGTVQVFELLADRGYAPWPQGRDRKADPVLVHASHNEIPFYNWRNQECVLAKGSTRATLRGRLWQDDTDECPRGPADDPSKDLYLKRGDFLLLEEVRSPVTGATADANPAHRHIVVLTTVTPGRDPVTGDNIVDVEWDSADALPFALCLSATSPTDAATCVQQAVSVARGNVLLVDQGETVSDPQLPAVPAAPSIALPSCQGEGPVVTPPTVPGRYRPALERGPLTWARPLPTTGKDEVLTAAALPAQDPRAALPAVVLVQTGGDGSAQAPSLAGNSVTAGLLPLPGTESHPFWIARRDLLADGPTDLNFVPEAEDEGRTYLRFGDDEHGRAVRLGDTFEADYRVGNGPAGNVGAERISRLGLPPGMDSWSGAGLTIRNPLPASGGTAPEPLEEVKRLAPEAFHTDLRRAVVAGDYAQLVTAHYPEVRRAAATRRWTGAGDLIVVAVDFLAAVPQARRDALLDPDQIAAYLEAFRRIGHAVSVREAGFAALDVALDVYLLSTTLRSPTIARLQQLFGTAPLPDGTLGFFDADNFSFGEGVAASRLVALAQGVAGVEHVVVKRLRRVSAPGGPDAPPFLTVGPLEVVRLDNDPNHAENGRLTLNVRGGR